MIPLGMRNEMLYDKALMIGSLVAARVLTREVAETRLQKLGELYGLTSEEVRKTAKAGLDAAMKSR